MVWAMKIKGMMARSVSFSAVSCDPSFAKTEESAWLHRHSSHSAWRSYLDKA